MVARQFQFLLLVELLIYGFFGSLLVMRNGWTPGAAAWLAVALFLGLRFVLVALTFLLSSRYGGEVPPESRIGPLQALRMFISEYLAFVLMFAFVIPFERLLLRADRLGHCATRALPVLLIHGYQCNRGFWFWIRNRLEVAGWTVATHNLEPAYSDIDRYAAGIARRIDEVRHATGADKVILVCHSMGGLACRAYLKRHGANRVARLITLGSPHRGTLIANLSAGPNARQMRIGSPWLGELGSAEVLPANSVSIFSHHDNYVFPQPTASRLPGATNIGIAGVGHVGMAISTKALARLQEALESPLERGL